MKSLPLLTCFAVIATASAADLKDPAIVASDWNKTIAQARTPAASTENLAQQSAALTPSNLDRTFQTSPIAPGNPGPAPYHFYDAPRAKNSDGRPEAMPRGAKPWHYRDQTYWLVPLGGQT